MTSSGLESRAVLCARRAGRSVVAAGRVTGRAGEREAVPGVHDHDVVHGRVALAEAGEAESDDHCCGVWMGGDGGWRGSALT